MVASLERYQCDFMTFIPPATPSPPSDRACQTLSEPAVDRSEQFARLLQLTLVAPEPREAHGGAEFPGFCLLLVGDSERAFEKASACASSLRRHSTISPAARLARPQPSFPQLFRRSSWLRNASSKRHRIDRVAHTLTPGATRRMEYTLSLGLTDSHAGGYHSDCNRSLIA